MGQLISYIGAKINKEIREIKEGEESHEKQDARKKKAERKRHNDMVIASYGLRKGRTPPGGTGGGNNSPGS